MIQNRFSFTNKVVKEQKKMAYALTNTNVWRKTSMNLNSLSEPAAVLDSFPEAI